MSQLSSCFVSPPGQQVKRHGVEAATKQELCQRRPEQVSPEPRFVVDLGKKANIRCENSPERSN